MIETKSDMMRRKVFDDASKDVAKNGFNLHQQQTMDERLNALRERQNRPKRRLPWITVLSVVSCLPFFIGGGEKQLSTGAMPGMTPEQIAQGKQVLQSIEGETATISITIGDKVITKEVPVSDIQKAMDGY
jgi:hypothetical protein